MSDPAHSARRVAAVIPHWNRAGALSALLEALPSQSRRFDRVIVVDNGSTDGSAELAEKAGATVVRLPRNEGFAVAVNRGIAAAVDCEWIAILNNDVTLDPAWLAHLLDAAEYANASFATGKILSARDRSIIDGCWDEISRGACPARCGAGAPDGPDWNQPCPIRMTSMTAALFRRALFDDLGPLDERFVSYLEDVDFALRCAKAGRAGVYVPSAVALHEGSSTWGRWHPDTVRLLSRNQVLLVFKHFRGQPRWPIVAGQLLWGLLALRHGCARAWIQGKLSGWQTRSEVSNDTRDHAAFGEMLRASEAGILAAQRILGRGAVRPSEKSTERRDLYWRLYAWLVPLASSSKTS